MKMKTDFETMNRQAAEMLAEEPWHVAAMSNLSALIMENMADLNWAGFYLRRGEGLVVGPFQGKPACIHIPMGKGVCGTTVLRDRTTVVPDVHAFPGHIACDSASRSEIVIPLHAEGRVAAVLDIDSPVPDRFSPEDVRGLEELAGLLENAAVW